MIFKKKYSLTNKSLFTDSLLTVTENVDFYRYVKMSNYEFACKKILQNISRR